MWRFIVSLDTIPTDCDLMLAVIDKDGLHQLEFRCRYRDGRWIAVETGREIDVNPTHWQAWPAS